MAVDRRKVAQALRAYSSLNDEEKAELYEIVRRHQSSPNFQKRMVIEEGMSKFGAIMGPSSGGCPRCGYPN